MEPYLGNPTYTKAVLRSHGITARKRFGQNFLIDREVLEDTVRAAGITKEDVVLEIGPGIGTLTQYLASAAGKVIAVEIDRSLQSVLADTLSGWKNVRIVWGDVLKLDLMALLSEELSLPGSDDSREASPRRSVKVAANLPYYITTPILMRLLEGEEPIESITIMVQKEVADRMTAQPGTKDYGALSLAVQYYASPECVRIVSPSSFIPMPGVDSAVMHLAAYKNPPVEVRDEKLMFALIRASFNQRRKTLVNGISSGAGLPFSKEQVREAVLRCGIRPDVRGEALSLAEFAALADALLAVQG